MNSTKKVLVANSKSDKKPLNRDAIYQNLRNACAITGLSQHYLRTGCKNNSIPHILVGQAYFIHMPSLLESIDPHASERSAVNGQ